MCFECGGNCKSCNEWNKNYGCMLRPCNRNKLDEPDEVNEKEIKEIFNSNIEDSVL